MYQLKGMGDTIVAISTPLGQGGLGVVRLSGDDALIIADKLFKTKSNRKPSQCDGFSVHYGWIIDKNSEEDVIDEALCTIMKAPKSYTMQNVVELSCHGGVVVLKEILNLAIDQGARLAEPGEFTKRAFINGRIDLTQAEAVLDVINSKTNSFLRVSTHQLKGDLSIELESIRENLMNAYIEIEAIVNFPEDDIDDRGRKKLMKDIEAAVDRVEKLLSSSDHGRILKDGIKIVLCGRANVGKSSLLNVFLQTPRAIVSDVAGTTRDTIEETAQIQGIPFQLVDTAGILEPRDLIEEEAIKRSQLYMQSADLILFLCDASQPLSEEDKMIAKQITSQNVVIVLNKSDLGEKINKDSFKDILPGKEVIAVSVENKDNIDSLQKLIVENVWHQDTIDTSGVMVSNLRHIESLKKCLSSINDARSTIDEGISLEFVSEKIKSAVNDLDAITGKNIDTDLIDNIFSQFCIGK